MHSDFCPALLYGEALTSLGCFHDTHLQKLIHKFKWRDSSQLPPVFHNKSSCYILPSNRSILTLETLRSQICFKNLQLSPLIIIIYEQKSEETNLTPRSELDKAKVLKLLCCFTRESLGPKWNWFSGQLFKDIIVLRDLPSDDVAWNFFNLYLIPKPFSTTT